ncbi:restriction endonuclease [Candidatus Roizmanbacteria bacterium]|nr:restriction endonuclease [Candidatus Roizmanbacteria bacterium]
MSFDEKIAALSQRIPKIKEHLQTEEATKNALVMPFIDALGYDIFNPKEVVPEFTADFGSKKGEKVDYAIMKDGEPCILIECKKVGADLSIENISQLYRYFSVTKARISILTNGTQYWFYSDLDEPNKMDEKPFLELDLERLKGVAVSEVKKMAKEDFDLDRMLTTASDLKIVSEIKKMIVVEIENPSEGFVRHFYGMSSQKGKFTAFVKDSYTRLVAKAFQEFVNERIDDRLRSALERENITSSKKAEEVISEPLPAGSDNGIITTEEELEGYRIVVAICSQKVNPERIVYRDSKSYLAILLDDKNWKWICRLWFNGKQKYIGLQKDKKEERVPISKVTDIYLHINEILGAIDLLEKPDPNA